MMSDAPGPVDEIEILSPALLHDEAETVARLRRLASELRIGLGWHYLLDLAWIIRRLGPVAGRTILDAGAGWGLMQWYLCEAGARVISVDRASRSEITLGMRTRYRVRGLRRGDLARPSEILVRRLTSGRRMPRGLAREAADLVHARFGGRRAQGQVIVYNTDLLSLDGIPTGSIDAVVAVSALEHNTLDHLPGVVTELKRVLRPGGRLLATVGAARDEDWFHEPSHGWCFTENSLRRIFGIGEDVRSNYDRYDQLFADVRSSAELRDELAAFYFRSGNNGMPWGVWNPQYVPVGVAVGNESI